MLQNTLLLFFYMLSFSLYSQENKHRFFYELTFTPSVNNTITKKSLMILDITKESSVFMDYQFVVSDSITQQNLKKFQKTGVYEPPKSNMNIDFSFTIIKNYNKGEIEFIDYIMNGVNPLKIGYIETALLDWKISNDKTIIDNYKCQKAYLNFGGRDWIAWFTNEIPISDGPYKFNGLPGLIVKIEDSNKNFSWELIGNKKVLTNVDNSSLNGIEYKLLTKENFNKTFNTYKQNPMISLQNNLSQEMLDFYISGINMKLGDFIKQEGSKIKEHYSTHTNSIEID